LLAGVEVRLDLDLAGSWVERLIATACRSGAPNMAALAPAARADGGDVAALFQAALCQDGVRLEKIACDLAVDPAAFRAVAELVPVPFLQACGRRAATPRTWAEGYCPICGAWPAFAEMRGIERGRYLRCGRCGGEWPFHPLVCSYCGMTDHGQLASLVPENGAATRKVDACKRCLGYVKSFAVLQAAPAARVMIEDLASVELDVAAMSEGYRRAEGPGFSLDAAVAVRKSALKKIFSWCL
ncbi:MAG TPA: formate dehydrogenase accessory protein FdhE, partial [Candidatus Binatia bacterium]